jgi:hypothetical protein
MGLDFDPVRKKLPRYPRGDQQAGMAAKRSSNIEKRLPQAARSLL